VEQFRESTGREAYRPGRRTEPARRAEELCRQVQQALGQLTDEPPEYFLVLREMEGCSYEMIAEILDLRWGRCGAESTARDCNCARNFARN